MKRTIALALSLLLILGLFSLVATASGTLAGDGSPGEPYQIGDYAQLKAFAAKVNGGETGANAVLTADIVCKNAIGDDDYATDWTPIGNSNKPYAGTFDGRDYVIYGLSNAVDCTDNNVGLFGAIDTEGVVKNVIRSGGVLYGVSHVGGIAGWSDGTVIRCTNDGAVKGKYSVGGVVGMNLAPLTDCTNTGDVTGTDRVGGIAGENNLDHDLSYVLSDCQNFGTVQGDTNVGGVIGKARRPVNDCQNFGDVTGTEKVGGVAGDISTAGELTGCANNGDVSATIYGGGVVGYADAHIQDCTNAGTAYATKYAGGIAGESKHYVRYCANIGKVIGTDTVGGLVGMKSRDSVIQCYNAGTVGGTVNVGALIGYQDKAYLADCCYDVSRTGSLPAVGKSGGTVENVQGLETGAMTTQTTNVYNAWSDFDEHWLRTESYPQQRRRLANAFPGSGTESDPFQIRDYAQLKAFAALVGYGWNDACAVLTGDVVCKDKISDAAYATDWTRIGDSAFPYVGTFDGYNHVILGLSNAADCTESRVGLFGVVGAGGVVKNVICQGGVLHGYAYVGGIVGQNGGTVTHCANTGDVVGVDRYNSEISFYIGGIAGLCLDTGTLTDCRNAGSVSGKDCVGGVVGYLYGVSTSQPMTGCFNTGSVVGNDNVGGVVGDFTRDIGECFNTGSVSGDRYVGGVAGLAHGDLSNCGNTGSVSGTTRVGGVVGIEAGKHVTQCFSGGPVYGTDNVGGVVGTAEHQSILDQNCFNADVSPQMHQMPAIGAKFGEVMDTETKAAGTSDMTGADPFAFSFWSGFSDHWTCTEYYPVPKTMFLSLSGSGSASDPFRLWKYTQLKDFAYLVRCGWTDACAVLVDDFVCKDFATDALLAADWRAIGTDLCPYDGVFDGRGHAITGLTTPFGCQDAFIGLFGAVGPAGEVKNVTLNEADLRYCNTAVTDGGYYRYAGGIAAYNNGTVSGCFFFGKIAGVSSVGGLVGLNNGSVIDGTNFGTVLGPADGPLEISPTGGLVGDNRGIVSGGLNTGAVSVCACVGGLVGRNENAGTLTRSVNGGTVTGYIYLGGLVGYNIGSVSESANTGAVTGSTYLGGLVGTGNGSAANCYNTGAVSGLEFVGGLVGFANYGTVSNGYSAATVSASYDAGGLAGYEGQSTLSNLYFNADKTAASAVGIAVTPGTYTNLRGLTTAEMTGLNATVYQDWTDFDQYWVLTAGYPQLKALSPSLAGSGTAEDPYRIGDYAQLKSFAALVNRGQTDACAVLTQDVVCKNAATDSDYAADWTPIGTALLPYEGTFDGQGHTLTGLSTTADCDLLYVGLFGRVGAAGTVKNVTVKDGDLCNKNTTQALTHPALGGIVGRNEGTLTGCAHNGNLTSGYACLGGIAGISTGTLTDCRNEGIVDGAEYVGGIVGEMSDHALLTDCCNDADVVGDASVGGIVGDADNGAVTGCFNTGDVLGMDGSTGGVAGDLDGGTVDGCRNNGAVTAFDDTAGPLGGLVGYSNGALTRSYNIGSVTGGDYVGGLVGYNYGTIANCYTTGDVSGDSTVGGLVGGDHGSVTNCYFAGNVTGSSTVGALVGLSQSSELSNLAFDYTKIEGAPQVIGGTQGAVTTSNVTYVATDEMTGRTTNAFQQWSNLDANWVLTDSYPLLTTFHAWVDADGTNGTTTGGGAYEKGSSVTLKAAPDTGSHFVGWQEGGTIVSTDKEITFTVTGNRALTAVYALDTFTVTFKNGDTVLQSSPVEYGKTPAYTGETPTKAPDAQYTYSFKGWDSDLSAVTGAKTYTATFNKTLNKYAVTFKNEDGTVLQSGPVEYGKTPAYTGETPTKAATAQYTYTFAGWDKTISAVTGTATYTAKFNETVNKYLITFKNGNDTLQSSEVTYGTTPAYTGATPTKAPDAQYTYTFAGWDQTLTAVTGEATYTATFDKTVNKYIVQFKDEAGNVLQTIEVAYGETPVYSGPTPTKAADKAYTYAFAGWTTSLSAVTGETTYTAAFTAQAIPQTGDRSQPMLWIALLILSGLALVGSLLAGRKRRA